MGRCRTALGRGEARRRGRWGCGWSTHCEGLQQLGALPRGGVGYVHDRAGPTRELALLHCPELKTTLRHTQFHHSVAGSHTRNSRRGNHRHQAVFNALPLTAPPTQLRRWRTRSSQFQPDSYHHPRSHYVSSCGTSLGWAPLVRMNVKQTDSVIAANLTHPVQRSVRSDGAVHRLRPRVRVQQMEDRASTTSFRSRSQANAPSERFWRHYNARIHAGHERLPQLSDGSDYRPHRAPFRCCRPQQRGFGRPARAVARRQVHLAWRKARVAAVPRAFSGPATGMASMSNA